MWSFHFIINNSSASVQKKQQDHFFGPEQEDKASFFRKKSDQSFFNKGSAGSSFFRKPNGYTAIQPKLTVSQHNDPYEQEAEAMENKVAEQRSEPSDVQTKS